MNKQEALNWAVVNVQDWEETKYECPRYCLWVLTNAAETVLIPTNNDNDWTIYKQDWLDAQPMSDSESVFIDSAEDEAVNITANELFDPVKRPSHYEILEGFQSIDIIASSFTLEQWKGFCLGNIIKYRLRAGKKDPLQQDIDKADQYGVLFDSKKHLCKTS